MSEETPGLIERIRRFVGQLKSPQLFLLVGSLFLLDLVILDPIPFIDEIILGIITLLVARWKKRRDEPAAPKPPPKNVTPS